MGKGDVKTNPAWYEGLSKRAVTNMPEIRKRDRELQRQPQSEKRERRDYEHGGPTGEDESE